MVLSLQPRLKRTRISVTTETEEPITVLSVPGAFSQVITNLILNAIVHAFAPEQAGTITIRTATHAETRIACVTVSDDGAGMSDETLRYIYEPFYTTNRSGGGTGLGMHIVYNLVTVTLGGTISCRSSVGRGTEFSISIPIDGPSQGTGL